jgi:hypothetical protein
VGRKYPNGRSAGTGIKGLYVGRALSNQGVGACKAERTGKMKAIRVHAFGTPDGVSFDEIERPEVGPADALVEIESASVNPLDVKMLTGAVREQFPQRSTK